ncbi:MAG: hypothetical protein ACTSVI_15800 [Promethearchaeota archaeon]
MPEQRIKKLRPSYGKSRSINVITRDLMVSKEVRENIEKAVKKMRFITPSDIASKFGIKISTAKELLAELEKKRIIKRYDMIKSPKLHVYIPAQNAN